MSSPSSVNPYSSPSLSRTHSQSKLTAPSTPTQRNLSSFAPWDRDQLISRLSTFKNVFWSQLPDELNELEWARRGWVERKDTVKGVECNLCKAKVEVLWDWEQLREKILSEREAAQEAEEGHVNGDHEPSETNGTSSKSVTPTLQKNPAEEDIYSKPGKDGGTDLLLQHYKPLLSSGHTSKCPWSTRTADPTILRLQPQFLNIPTLITRLQSLTPILSSLPPAERLLTPKPLPISLPAGLADYDHRLLQCGVTGWSGSQLGTRGLLTCTTCHRRVGLWLFTETTGDNELRWEEEQLDLVREHKRYCPWVNKETQTGGMPGWEVMMSMLEPRKRKLVEEDGNGGKESQFKRLREMLKGIRK